jgi:hypothetical protein
MHGKSAYNSTSNPFYTYSYGVTPFFFQDPFPYGLDCILAGLNAWQATDKTIDTNATIRRFSGCIPSSLQAHIRSNASVTLGSTYLQISEIHPDLGNPATLRAGLGVSLYLDIMGLVTTGVQIGKLGWSSGNIAAF